MGIISKIGPLALLGIGILFLGNALVRPAQATATAQALTSSGVGLGASLGSIGSGIQSLFTGVGTGASKLLNPLFTIKDLIGYSGFEGEGAGSTTQSGFNTNTGLSSGGTPLTASPQVRNFVETLDPSYVLNTNATYSFIEDNYSPTDQIAIKRAIESSRAQFPQYFSGGASSR
jgi:hypothetical protein|tara:strand:+ start:3077 stop:3598 length:522 start_codon:yes stop_codon:yes gene_type:complete